MKLSSIFLENQELRVYRSMCRYIWFLPYNYPECMILTFRFLYFKLKLINTRKAISVVWDCSHYYIENLKYVLRNMTLQTTTLFWQLTYLRDLISIYHIWDKKRWLIFRLSEWESRNTIKDILLFTVLLTISV